VESGTAEYLITKHGKTIGLISAPEPSATPAPILGAGIGTATLSPNYKQHASA